MARSNPADRPGSSSSSHAEEEKSPVSASGTESVAEDQNASAPRGSWLAADDAAAGPVDDAPAFAAAEVADVGFRAKRVAVSKKKRKPVPKVSNEHYVGYVEDDESVEAIMKKFEAMERVQSTYRDRASEENEYHIEPLAYADLGGDGDEEAAVMDEGLRRRMFEEVFTETAMFTPEYAAAAPDLEHEDDLVDFITNVANGINLGDDDGGDGSGSDYDSGDAESDFDPYAPFGSSRRRLRGEGARRPHGSGRGERMGHNRAGEPNMRKLGNRIAGSSVTTLVMKRLLIQMKANRSANCWTDPFKLEKVKIPKKEVKWYNKIVPYSPPLAVNSPGTRYFEGNILRMTADTLGNEYQGIYIDPPVLLPGEESVPEKYTVEEFGKMKVQDLLPGRGFLFIWTHKSQTVQWLKMARDCWGLHHVESMVWAKKTIGNRIAHTNAKVPGTLFAANCYILLILRYTKVYVELRHQRNCDVHFQPVIPAQPGDLTERKPNWVFNVIETLLPEGRWHPEWPNGDRLLYLFAEKNFTRKGWTAVSHIPEKVSTIEGAGVTPVDAWVQSARLVPSKRALSLERKVNERRIKVTELGVRPGQ